MLEFLKEFNQYSIYERAMDCETNLGSFNPATPMATFIETLLKSIYLEFNTRWNEQTVGELSLNELLKEETFIRRLCTTYFLKESDLKVIDEKLRPKSNSYKHKLIARTLSAEDVKTCFHILYEVAANYYSVKTNNPAPAWSEDSYKKLLASCLDSHSREKAEAQYKSEIEDLKRALSAEKSEKTDALLHIENLKRQLTEAKFESVNTETVNRLQKKISQQEDEISKVQAERLLLLKQEEIARKKIEVITRELNRLQEEQSPEKTAEAESLQAINQELLSQNREAEEKAEALNAQNQKLLSRIQELESEKEKTAVKLEKLALTSKQSDKIADLEELLAQKERLLEVSKSRIEEMTAQLDRLQTKLKTETTQLGALSQEYDKTVGPGLAAREEIKRISPKCPQCNSILRPINGPYGWFWGCSAWKRTKCDTKIPIREREIPLVQRIQALDEIKIPHKIFSLPPEQLEQIQRPTIAIRHYPTTLGQKFPIEFMFESLSVPYEIFKDTDRRSLKKYAKFQIVSSLDRPDADLAKLDAKQKTIYSLALRILNRGAILSIDKKTEDTLRAKFNQRKIGHLDALAGHIRYAKPENPYGSKREKAFAEYYFPKVLGENWASYVLAQAPIDVLIDDERKQFVDRRVDFLISKNQQKIVIELDGKEHDPRVDARRDEALKSGGYHVLRFTNDAVDQREPEIEQVLSQAIGNETDPEDLVELDERFFSACKLEHQLAIAVIKALEQGYICESSNLSANASSSLFSKEEIGYIFSVALSEVYDLLENLSALYGFKTEWNFQESNKDEFVFSIGDGLKPHQRGLTIRDCALPYDYLCEIAPFSQELMPVDPSESTLEFFLRYIFRKKEFHEGQYEGIRRLLMKEDSIVLLPTGSGKSLIYQLSSFLVPGLIVVISPLVSLIQDQVTNLERNYGITNAIYFTSANTREEKIQRERSRMLMQHIATSLIYIAPERLQIPSFRNDIAKMKNYSKNIVYGVAIDEAHCVSEWGHDFRPAYLNVGNSTRTQFRAGKHIPVITALTGTASDIVLRDMQAELKIYEEEALIKPSSFGREELHFSIESCSAKDKAATIARMIQQNVPAQLKCSYEDIAKLNVEDASSGIIFTPLANKESQYGAHYLKKALSSYLPGLSIENYFSSLPEEYEDETWKETIRENAARFKDNKINVLVATKAFGMGIDKPNIRYVVHDGIPISFEEYYQEAGRAGRDRKNSECLLIFSNDNDKRNREILNPDLSYDEFKEKLEKPDPGTETDDVSALIYFHSNSFKGKEEEKKQIKKVLGTLAQVNFEGEEVRHLLGPDDEDKECMKALVRLEILGIVTDYSYNYSNVFAIRLGTKKREEIIDNLERYIISAGPGTNKNGSAATSYVTKLKELSSTEITDEKFISAAVDSLVDFIYDRIESSRRRCIYEMYDAACTALAQPKEDQHDYISKRITAYFNTTGEEHEELTRILDAPNAGLEEIEKIFGLSPQKAVYTPSEKRSARSLYVMAGRKLETKPDHPGLLITQAVARIISGDFENSYAVDNIKAAVRRALKEYEIGWETVAPTLSEVINLALNYSTDLCDKLLRELPDATEKTKKELLGEMICSKGISDENRDYLMLSYANEKTKHFAGA